MKILPAAGGWALSTGMGADPDGVTAVPVHPVHCGRISARESDADPCSVAREGDSAHYSSKP